MNAIYSNDKYLIFNASGVDYALPVSDVYGILTLHRSEISTVPFDSGGNIRGIFSYKGGIVALLYCKGISAKSDEYGEENLTAVFLKCDQRYFAVLVDYAKTVTDIIYDKNVIMTDANTLYGGENDDKN